MTVGNRDILVRQTFEETAPPVRRTILVPAVIGVLKNFFGKKSSAIMLEKKLSMICLHIFPRELLLRI